MKSHARIGTALLLLSLAPSLAATAPVRAGGATYDAGDGYRSGGRWVDLLRRDGEWVLAAPTAAAAARRGEVEMVLDAPHPALAPRSLGVARRRSHSRLQGARTALDELRAWRRRDAAAGPVFADPRSGLRLVARDRIIVRLKGGAPPSSLPVEFLAAQPLPGTADQFVLRLPPTTPEALLALVSRLDGLPQVAWAEPDFLRQWRRARTVNDPLTPEQWHLHNLGYTAFGQPYSPADVDIDAPAAWDRSFGSTQIVVAVIDDGIPSSHPDLAANLAVNTGETGDNGLDDDQNGYVDDLLGWDFVLGTSNAAPQVAGDGHGTAVAGLAAAAADNAIGVAGVAPDCRLLSVKIFRGDDYAGDSNLANAIRYAAGLTAPQGWRGADVINMSFGGGEPVAAIDTALHDAATLGRGGRGCVLLAAAGNGASAYIYNSRTLEPGTYYCEWRYKKDNIFSSYEDACRLGLVIFPDGVIERFDAPTAPAGWNLKPTTDAGWYVEDNPARAFSTGRYQLRSQAIGNRKTATMRSRTFTVSASGTLGFMYWVSTEYTFDWLQFRAVKSGAATPSFENVDSGAYLLDPYVGYPANHADVIAVGATAEFDYRSDFSQYGEDLDVAAPGGGGLVGIVTTDRTGADGYDSTDYTDGFAGTSASAPIASGTVALLLSRHPDLTAVQARALLRRTCDKVGAVSYSGGDEGAGGFNPFYGYGRINAGRLLRLARAQFASAPHGTIAPPDGLWTLFCDPNTVATLDAQPDQYYSFDRWVAAPEAAATIFQPQAAATSLAIVDDVTVTGTFAPLRAALGTPHYWLAGHGLDTPSFDAAELTDGDGDGHAAWQEWQADTSPTNGESVLRLRGLERLPDGRCILSWSSVPTRRYDVLGYGAPTGTPFVLHADVAPTPPLNVATSAPLPFATHFFRVRTAAPAE